MISSVKRRQFNSSSWSKILLAPIHEQKFLLVFERLSQVFQIDSGLVRSEEETYKQLKTEYIYDILMLYLELIGQEP